MADYNISDFAEKLLTEKGVSGVPDDVREQMRKDIEDRIERLLNTEILASMPQNALEEFEEKLDNASDEDVQAFVRAKIPNIDEVVAASLLKFRNIYIGNLL